MATIKRLKRSTWSSPFAGLQWQLTIQFPLPGGSTSITLASHCRVKKEPNAPPSTLSASFLQQIWRQSILKLVKIKIPPPALDN